MAKTVIVTADKIKKRERIIKYLKYGLFISFSLLLGLFIVLNFVYNGGKFSINLDKKLSEQSSIVLYSDSIGKDVSRKLFAEDIEYMDNISINWIPKNIDTILIAVAPTEARKINLIREIATFNVTELGNK